MTHWHECSDWQFKPLLWRFPADLELAWELVKHNMSRCKTSPIAANQCTPFEMPEVTSENIGIIEQLHAWQTWALAWQARLGVLRDPASVPSDEECRLAITQALTLAILTVRELRKQGEI